MIIITDLCLLGPQATFVEEGSQHILTKLPSNHRYIPLRANSLVSKCDSQKKKKKKKKNLISDSKDNKEDGLSCCHILREGCLQNDRLDREILVSIRQTTHCSNPCLGLTHSSPDTLQEVSEIDWLSGE